MKNWFLRVLFVLAVAWALCAPFVLDVFLGHSVSDSVGPSETPVPLKWSELPPDSAVQARSIRGTLG